MTSLIDLVKNNDIEGVKKYIKSGKDLNIQNEYGNTGLIFACYYGYKKIVKLLISSGCDLNIQNNSGSTGLIWGCYNGYEKIVSQLISSGCDLNIQDKEGDTGLIWSCHKDRIEVATKLIRSNSVLNIKNNEGKTYQSYIKPYQQESFNRAILGTGLIGSLIRYIIEHKNKYKIEDSRRLPRSIRRELGRSINILKS